MKVAKNNPSSALFGIYRLLIISFVLFALYFAQTILIPFAIAALLAFLLAPLSSWLERWVGRVFSIFVIVLVVFSTLWFVVNILIKQFISFLGKFPIYFDLIKKRIESFHFPENGFFQGIIDALVNLKNRLSDSGGDISPLESKLIDLGSNFAHYIESFFGSFFNALTMTGIVTLLVIFMLLNRDDIRSRIVKLIGQGKISSATSAMDDASIRVFTYLFRLFIVNIVFGFVIFLGLYGIGIPNAILWGSLAGILRFIPYIGAPLAAIIPIGLSFIMTDTWQVPVMTIGFFISVELITAYIVEPYYFGMGTGVSSLALILAAIFWTWLWGPIGLLLSTPLTVCLIVIGRHVPNMDFLRVLLSKEEALTPAEECYYHLLSLDTSEAIEVIEAHVKNNSLVSAYDSVLIPTITQTETDLHLENIDAHKKEDVYQCVSEIIELLSQQDQKEPSLELKAEEKKILCFPAKTLRDELGVSILSQMLARDQFIVHHTTNLKAGDLFTLVKERNPDVVCLVAVAPFMLSYVSFLTEKLHHRMPNIPIVVCLLGGSPLEENMNKLISGGATKVALTVQDAIRYLVEMRGSIPK